MNQTKYKKDASKFDERPLAQGRYNQVKPKIKPQKPASSKRENRWVRSKKYATVQQKNAKTGKKGLGGTIKPAIEQPDFTNSKTQHDLMLIGSDGKKLYAHKAVLSLWSEHFRDLFAIDDMKQLKLEDAKGAHLIEMLNVIYPPDLESDVNDKNVMVLLDLADKYKMVEVNRRCETCLLSRKPSVTLLVTAQTYRLNSLLEKCITSLRHRTFRDLQREKRFKEISDDNMVKLFSQKIKQLETKTTVAQQKEKIQNEKFEEMQRMFNEIKVLSQKPTAGGQREREDIIRKCDRAMDILRQAVPEISRSSLDEDGQFSHEDLSTILDPDDYDMNDDEERNQLQQALEDVDNYNNELDDGSSLFENKESEESGYGSKQSRPSTTTISDRKTPNTLNWDGPIKIPDDEGGSSLGGSEENLPESSSNVLITKDDMAIDEPEKTDLVESRPNSTAGRIESAKFRANTESEGLETLQTSVASRGPSRVADDGRAKSQALTKDDFFDNEEETNNQNNNSLKIQETEKPNSGIRTDISNTHEGTNDSAYSFIHGKYENTAGTDEFGFGSQRDLHDIREEEKDDERNRGIELQSQSDATNSESSDYEDTTAEEEENDLENPVSRFENELDKHQQDEMDEEFIKATTEEPTNIPEKYKENLLGTGDKIFTAKPFNDRLKSLNENQMDRTSYQKTPLPDPKASEIKEEIFGREGHKNSAARKTEEEIDILLGLRKISGEESQNVAATQNVKNERKGRESVISLRQALDSRTEAGPSRTGLGNASQHQLKSRFPPLSKSESNLEPTWLEELKGGTTKHTGRRYSYANVPEWLHQNNVNPRDDVDLESLKDEFHLGRRARSSEEKTTESDVLPSLEQNQKTTGQSTPEVLPGKALRY